MKDPNENEIDVARRLLAELAEMAEHASLTHGLRGGERSAALAYNRVLTTFAASGQVPEGILEALPAEGAEYGEIGVRCRLLLAIVGEKASVRGKNKDREGGLGALVALAPFLDSADLGAMIRERIDDASEVPDGLLTSLAPFLDSEDLGDLVRRRIRPRRPEAPPEPSTAPPSPDLRPVVHAPSTLESLADELRRPDLTVEDRQRIATQLAEMAYAQSVHAIG